MRCSLQHNIKYNFIGKYSYLIFTVATIINTKYLINITNKAVARRSFKVQTSSVTKRDQKVPEPVPRVARNNKFLVFY
jgi:hypothetical protein